MFPISDPTFAFWADVIELAGYAAICGFSTVFVWAVNMAAKRGDRR